MLGRAHQRYTFFCATHRPHLTIRGAGGFSSSSVSHQQKLNTNTQQCLFVSIMSSVRAAEREMHRGEDEDDERRRQRKLEEALEVKSLRRIISAYLKYLSLSILKHSSLISNLLIFLYDFESLMLSSLLLISTSKFTSFSIAKFSAEIYICYIILYSGLFACV